MAPFPCITRSGDGDSSKLSKVWWVCHYLSRGRVRGLSPRHSKGEGMASYSASLMGDRDGYVTSFSLKINGDGMATFALHQERWE